MEHVPLNKLILSPRNVRTNVEDATALAELTASIEAHGLLNPLVVTGTKKPEVVAGGRRYRALCQLAEAGKIDADYQVPVKLVEASAAVEVSLAENFVRKQMRDYEIYNAFRLTAEATKADAATIARRFGIDAKRAERILRLGNLHPAIFDAYRTGQINDEVARAFAATADTTRQADAWAAFQRLPVYDQSAWRVRDLLGMGDRNARNDLALVGIETYEAAGGKIERDLFSDAVAVSDLDLLDRLKTAKQEELYRAALARCSRPVEEIDPSAYNLPWNAFYRPERGDLTGKAKKRVDALIELMDETQDEDAYAEAEAEANRLMNERPYLIPEDMTIGAYRRGGQIEFVDLSKASPVDDEPEAAADADAAPEQAAEADEPAITPSKKALEVMALLRRERLIERTTSDLVTKTKAIDLLLFTIARTCFMGHYNYDARGLSTVDAPEWRDMAWMQDADADAAFAMFTASTDRDALAAEMLARMTQAKRADERSAHITWLAGQSAKLRWQSSETFWALFNKKQIFAMVEQFAPSAVPFLVNAKQAEVRAMVHDLCSAQDKIVWKGLPSDELAAAQAWVPEWLSFPDEQA